MNETTLTEEKSRALRNCIEQKIEVQGSIPFSEFMEIVLYHPEWGYYSTRKETEDYYTSADVHPVFSRILARYCIGEWERNHKNQKTFTLMELGAGTGKLAEPILQTIQEESPDCYQALHYVGIEISPARRSAWNQLALRHAGKVQIRKKFDYPEYSIRGIIFSNEFFDALPFRRVIRQNDRIREIRIGRSFLEITSEPPFEIRDYFRWLGSVPSNDCMGEASLESRRWIRKIGCALARGTILTIDYGHTAKELYSSFRTEGTAICHWRQEANRSFYERLGSQDITAHVNFTTLCKEGEAWGLRAHSLKTQTQFLMENGLETLIESVRFAGSPKEKLRTSAAIQGLIHPGGMGEVFKILIQEKHPRHA